MIIGMLHVHTIFSYDGKIGIEELWKKARKEGLSFIVLADHVETLLERKNIGKFLEKVEGYDSFPFIIPGFEYTCSPRVHLLAIGIKGIVENYKDPVHLIESTHREGGLVIWGHYDFKLKECDIEILSKVDGVEIWNRKYDGTMSFLPYKGRLFNLIRNSYNNNLKMYNGTDIHSFSHWSRILVTMQAVSSRAEIMNALRVGNFEIVNKYIHISARDFCPALREYILMQIMGILNFLIIKTKDIGYYLCCKLKIPIHPAVRETFRKLP